MTIHRYEKRECPVCSAKNRVLVWDTTNAQVNPEAKAALLNGETNLYICRACGKCFLMDKPLLYHDMEIGYMAWHFHFSLVQSGKILEWIDPGGQARGIEDCPECDYAASIHYVFDMDELVRYIRFRDVLGDGTRRSQG